MNAPLYAIPGAAPAPAEIGPPTTASTVAEVLAQSQVEDVLAAHWRTR